MDRGAWWVTDTRVAKESDTTEPLNNSNVDRHGRNHPIRRKKFKRSPSDYGSFDPNS